MRMHWTNVLAAAAAMAVGVIGLGCDRGGQAQGPAGPPPVAVTVSHPVRQEVIEWDEYNGRLAAAEEVEVRPRLNGYLQSVHFQEGAIVRQGDLLFVIDPAPFQATYDQAEAELQRAQAQLDFDTAEFKRIEELRASGSGSVKEYEDARLRLRQATAALAKARAELQSAQLNLDYTKVLAPIPGRIGRRLVTPGNLVGGPGGGGASQSTVLTTIVSIDPIYCYVDADERSVLKYQRLSREHRRVSARDARIPCRMALSDEKEFRHEGYIDFVNNALDPNTGTLTARGIFPNQDGTLTPGLFARLRIPGTGPYEALLVPDQAILTDQDQKYVMVADQGNVARYRRIEPGPLHGALRVVTGGLKDTDSVIINGHAKVRPGAPINPTRSQIEPTDAGGVGAEAPTTQTRSLRDPTTREVNGVGAATRAVTTRPVATQTRSSGKTQVIGFGGVEERS